MARSSCSSATGRSSVEPGEKARTWVFSRSPYRTWLSAYASRGSKLVETNRLRGRICASLTRVSGSFISAAGHDAFELGIDVFALSALREVAVGDGVQGIRRFGFDLQPACQPLCEMAVQQLRFAADIEHEQLGADYRDHSSFSDEIQELSTHRPDVPIDHGVGGCEGELEGDLFGHSSHWFFSAIIFSAYSDYLQRGDNFLREIPSVGLDQYSPVSFAGRRRKDGGITESHMQCPRARWLGFMMGAVAGGS